MLGRHAADVLGWVATAVFVASYFFRRAAALRGAQMIASVLWILYGVFIAAKPVIAANVLVFAAAGWTLLRDNAVVREAVCGPQGSTGSSDASGLAHPPVDRSPRIRV